MNHDLKINTEAYYKTFKMFYQYKILEMWHYLRFFPAECGGKQKCHYTL
ncbi:MAG: hypothetical protein LBR79_02785 [Oscillospiraceae bacterium]|nr:hypothetical protein [Oscillospiraceae bacterium]